MLITGRFFFFLLFDGEIIAICVVVALCLVPLKRRWYRHTIDSKSLHPAWSLNVVAGLRSWNFQSSFMCHRDQKSVLGLWRKVGGKDIHFWPLKETLHWPMKECVVSLRKPMTIILAGPFRSDLFQPFILRFLIVSWNQLASWLWRWIGLDHKGYITKIQQLFHRTVDKNGCRVSATYLSPNHGGQQSNNDFLNKSKFLISESEFKAEFGWSNPKLTIQDGGSEH